MTVNGSTPEAIESDIARQRDELAATVDELRHRLDVKTQAKEKAADLKDRATTETGRPRPDLAVAAVVAIAATVALVLWRRSNT